MLSDRSRPRERVESIQRSAAERPQDVFDQQDQVQIVGGGRLELGDQVKVEAASFSRLGVHEQPSTADLDSEFGRPGDDILQHPGTEAPTLAIDVHTEPREQGDGLGIPSGALAQPIRSVPDRDARHAPGVVRDDCAAISLSRR